jgi:nucleotide-binding universal stress UspA family protein
MKEIIVGLDGSAASNRALRWALQQAQLYDDARMVVVHAYRLPELRRASAYTESYLPAGALERRAEQEHAVRAKEETEAHERAERLIADALAAEGGKPEGTVIEQVVVASEPAKTLIELSEGADLLVLGSRGLGGFQGLLVGSVSHKCLHHANCPVVVIR